MPDQVSRQAHAKLNLALAVGPRIGGMGPHANRHRINSWMHAIDLADEITLTKRPDDGSPDLDHFSIAWADDAPCPSPIDWQPGDDLTLRALRILERKIGRTLPVTITISKRIPPAAGLAGGSSDAAATLLALDELFELAAGTERLASLWPQLGSDLGFFLRSTNAPPSPAFAHHLGDIYDDLPASTADLLLICSPLRCPTRDIYARYDEMDMPRAPRHFNSKGVLEAVGPVDTNLLMNDLTTAACAQTPHLADLIAACESVAGTDRIHLTGSGSALFIVRSPNDPPDRRARLQDAATNAVDGARVIETTLV